MDKKNLSEFFSVEVVTINFLQGEANCKIWKETEDYVYYVRIRKLVMNFIISLNVLFKYKRKNINKKIQTESVHNKLQLCNVFRKQNKLTKICKLIVERIYNMYLAIIMKYFKQFSFVDGEIFSKIYQEITVFCLFLFINFSVLQVIPPYI